MVIGKILAFACLIAPLVTASAAAQDRAKSQQLRELIDKVHKAPIVYEVSKAGKNQRKLFQVFSTVRDANGGTLSKDEFIRRLKAAEHFEIKFPEKCRVCDGWGRIAPARGKRDKDGKVRCPRCHGKRSEMRPHLVKWSAAMNTHKGDRRDPIMAALRRALGDKASALVWFNAARKYDGGELKEMPNARQLAHAAYEEAVKRANAAWRDDQPVTSDLNKIHRSIIDDGLKGIADTAPKRNEKKETPLPAPAEKAKKYRIEETQ